MAGAPWTTRESSAVAVPVPNGSSPVAADAVANSADSGGQTP